ncbi:MAG: ABC transporter ATP-binding protein [Desulfotomaculaceae bacterium]|nr:ABC transporter ATP-binding protein [Desulfotomaculaceae bacterium]
MEPVLIVTDLVQKVGKKTVLNGVSFTVHAGERFGLFGVKGAGKTTLLHILAGVDRFTSGSVETLGYDVRKSGAFKKHTGLVTQKRSLFEDLNTYENLDFIAALKCVDKDNIFSVIDRLELREYLNKPVKSLEAGVYQRLSVACALLNDPDLLIADELINGIDIYSRHIILKELERFLSNGGTCVRGYSDIRFCEQMCRVGWLEGGKITLYTPVEAIEQWDRQIQALSCQNGTDDD